MSTIPWPTRLSESCFPVRYVMTLFWLIMFKGVLVSCAVKKKPWKSPTVLCVAGNKTLRSKCATVVATNCAGGGPIWSPWHHVGHGLLLCSWSSMESWTGGFVRRWFHRGQSITNNLHLKSLWRHMETFYISIYFWSDKRKMLVLIDNKINILCFHLRQVWKMGKRFLLASKTWQPFAKKLFKAILTVFLGLWKQLRVFFFLVDWEKPNGATEQGTTTIRPPVSAPSPPGPPGSLVPWGSDIVVLVGMICFKILLFFY